jgi:hypothetical protein
MENVWTRKGNVYIQRTKIMLLIDFVYKTTYIIRILEKSTNVTDSWVWEEVKSMLQIFKNQNVLKLLCQWCKHYASQEEKERGGEI